MNVPFTESWLTCLNAYGVGMHDSATNSEWLGTTHTHTHAHRKSYLKAACRQETRYQKKIKELVHVHSEGDTVGIKIHHADRTNTDARLLPCKVHRTKMRESGQQCQVYTAAGIIRSICRPSHCHVSSYCHPNKSGQRREHCR